MPRRYIFLSILCAATRKGCPGNWTALLGCYLVRIEVDADGYPNEHVAVGDTVVLGHAHTDAVASLFIFISLSWAATDVAFSRDAFLLS